MPLKGNQKKIDADGDNENTDFKYFEYIPPEGYCGAKRFLDEGLVKQSEPHAKISNGNFFIRKYFVFSSNS